MRRAHARRRRPAAPPLRADGGRDRDPRRRHDGAQASSPTPSRGVSSVRGSTTNVVPDPRRRCRARASSTASRDLRLPIAWNFKGLFLVSPTTGRRARDGAGHRFRGPRLSRRATPRRTPAADSTRARAERRPRARSTPGSSSARAPRPLPARDGDRTRRAPPQRSAHPKKRHGVAALDVVRGAVPRRSPGTSSGASPVSDLARPPRRAGHRVDKVGVVSSSVASSITSGIYSLGPSPSARGHARTFGRQRSALETWQIPLARETPRI